MPITTETPNGKASSADLSAQVETLRKDLADLTNIIADLGKAKGEDAISAAKSSANAARDKVVDHAETARLQAMELQDQANSFVKNQPAAALGIAAGIGFLIGMLGSRK